MNRRIKTGIRITFHLCRRINRFLSKNQGHARRELYLMSCTFMEKLVQEQVRLNCTFITRAEQQQCSMCGPETA